MKTKLFSLACLLLVTYGANAATLTVGLSSSDTTGYVNYATITEALTASSSGDTLWVAAGTYTENELTIPAGVALIGGFPAAATKLSDRSYPGTATNLTILDGGAMARLTATTAAGAINYHRVATVHGVMDGCVIRGGYARGNNGGGVLVDGSAAVVQNCIIKGNVALSVLNATTSPSKGGGAYLQNDGSLINCVVAFNMANNGYGVAGAGKVINNTITSNTYAPLAVKVKAGFYYPSYPNQSTYRTTISNDFYLTQTETTASQYAVFCAALNLGASPTFTFASTYPMVPGSSTSANARYFASNSTTTLNIHTSGSTNYGGVIRVGNDWVPVAGKENYPMVYVCWGGSLLYSLFIGGTLPTEAQWELAARQNGDGSMVPYIYAGASTVENVAWYPGNASSTTHTVATKAPNFIGLYDMSGNVNEFMADNWGADYNTANYTSPLFITTSNPNTRVILGGSWGHGWTLNDRSNTDVNNADAYYGFRPLLVP